MNQGIVAGISFFSTTAEQGTSYAAGQSTLIFYSDLDLLYADTDGAGGLHPNLLAAFDNDPTLTASDFTIV